MKMIVIFILHSIVSFYIFLQMMNTYKTLNWTLFIKIPNFSTPITYRNCTVLFITRGGNIMLKLLVLGRTNDAPRMRYSPRQFWPQSTSIWQDCAPATF